MMRPLFNPAEIIRLQFRFGLMLAEAQMVIGMRMMGLAGMWRVTPTENARMVSEKLAAAQESAFAATRAVLQGRSPAIVADHALKPIRRRTSANTRRLARRGPGTP
ncbi:MAG: antifreeze protein [Tabrizicola sp.]|jgi:hypothetical protein|nr:antifreeze protein [Tabrizicola sp.]